MGEKRQGRTWALDNKGVKVPPLTAATVAPASERQGHRARRWRIMRSLRGLALASGLRSVAYCSTTAIETGATVSRTADGCAWTGLQRCKSPHACPRCSLDIAKRNAATVQALEEAAKAKGLAVDLVTLTHPHTATDSLETMLGNVLGAWSNLWRSSSFRARMKSAGFVGAVRAFEATHGAAGWHVHLHVAVFRSHASEQSSQLLIERWLSSDLTRSRKAQDVQWNVGDVAAYVGKGSMRLGAELSAGNATKQGKGGNRSPMQLAEAVASKRSDPATVNLWREWLTSTKGRRAWHVIGRKALEAALGVSVAEATEPDNEVLSPVAVFTLEQWATIRAQRSEAFVLTMFETYPDCRLHYLAPSELGEFLLWVLEHHGADPPFVDVVSSTV